MQKGIKYEKTVRHWIQTKLQEMKIQTAVMGVFTLLILVSSIAFFILALGFTEHSVIKNSEEYTEQLIRQVNNDMDSYMNYMKDISSMKTNLSVRKNSFWINIAIFIRHARGTK